MAASLNTVLFLSVCQLLSASAVLEPQEQPAQPGDNVTLPCQAPNNVTVAAVEWTRSDLNKYVYFQRSKRPQTQDQDPSYVNRVQLKGEMKDGELSLILKNVNSTDNGRYECRYVRIKGRRSKRATIDSDPISIIDLNVKGQTAGNTEGEKYMRQCLGAGLSVGLIVLVLAVGLVIFKKSKGHLKNISDPLVNEAEVHQQLQEKENSQSKTIFDIQMLNPPHSKLLLNNLQT